MKPMKVIASMLFWFTIAVLVTAFLNIAHAAPVANVLEQPLCQATNMM